MEQVVVHKYNVRIHSAAASGGVSLRTEYYSHLPTPKGASVGSARRGLVDAESGD